MRDRVGSAARLCALTGGKPAGVHTFTAVRVEELDRTFRRSSLKVLPKADTRVSAVASLFAAPAAEGRRNQFDRFVSTWRSRCAVVADRA